MSKKTPRLMPLAVGVCLCLAPAAVGQAPPSYPAYPASYPRPNYGPPRYPVPPPRPSQAVYPVSYPPPFCLQPPQPGNCPPGPALAPQLPGPSLLPAEQPKEQPAEQPKEQRESTRPGERPSTPQTPQQPEQPQQPQAPQQPEAPAAPEAGAGAEAGAAAGAGAEGGAAGAGAEAGGAGGGAEAGLGGGGAESSGGFLGRGDSNNRFNIFDNMSPYPANRLWLAYEYMEGFQTGVQPNPSNPAVTQGFANRRNETLYRMGGEITPFGPNISIAFQTEYIASADTPDRADAWGNPQGIVKLLVSQTEGSALALTFGLQPQAASHDGELHEKSTRFYPGFLYSQGLTRRLFFQGGFQVGISDRNDPNTVDYALSLGYWLYGCPLPAGMPRMCGGCGPCITGIIPQIELYGKHVVANDTSDPFELPGDPLIPNSSAPFREPRNVYDITVGGRILFRNGVSWGTAYSFPVTGPDVRRSELYTSLTFFF
jgi:hypothetical protein